MNLTDLKEMFYLRILDVIPNIVLDHINEMNEYDELDNFLSQDPSYRDSLSKTFQYQTMALFFADEEYTQFLRKSEAEGYKLGKAFASNTQLTLKLILLITNSTRVCSLRHFLKVLHGTEINIHTSLLIERVFELSNYRQNAFFRGYVDFHNEILRSQSITDPLTNVFNRRHFYERVLEEMKRAYRIDYPLTLMLIDIDNLKQVNDELGHLEGDKLLKHFTQAVSRIRSNFDSVFRFGGDEFVLILPNCTEENAAEIGNRLDEELRTYNSRSSISFGTVEIPLTENPEDVNIDRYINLADLKMYESKHSDKNKNSY